MQKYWQELEIDETDNIKSIKKAYSKKLKTINSLEDPEAFIKLREAYEKCLEFAKQPKQDSPNNEESNNEVSNNTTKDDYKELSQFKNSSANNVFIDLSSISEEKEITEEEMFRYDSKFFYTLEDYLESFPESMSPKEKLIRMIDHYHDDELIHLEDFIEEYLPNFIEKYIQKNFSSRQKQEEFIKFLFTELLDKKSNRYFLLKLALKFSQLTPREIKINFLEKLALNHFGSLDDPSFFEKLVYNIEIELVKSENFAYKCIESYLMELSNSGDSEKTEFTVKSFIDGQISYTQATSEISSKALNLSLRYFKILDIDTKIRYFHKLCSTDQLKNVSMGEVKRNIVQHFKYLGTEANESNLYEFNLALYALFTKLTQSDYTKYGAQYVPQFLGMQADEILGIEASKTNDLSYAEEKYDSAKNQLESESASQVKIEFLDAAIDFKKRKINNVFAKESGTTEDEKPKDTVSPESTIEIKYPCKNIGEIIDYVLKDLPDEELLQVFKENEILFQEEGKWERLENFCFQYLANQRSGLIPFHFTKYLLQKSKLRYLPNASDIFKYNLKDVMGRFYSYYHVNMLIEEAYNYCEHEKLKDKNFAYNLFFRRTDFKEIKNIEKFDVIRRSFKHGLYKVLLENEETPVSYDFQRHSFLWWRDTIYSSPFNLNRLIIKAFAVFVIVPEILNIESLALQHIAVGLFFLLTNYVLAYNFLSSFNFKEVVRNKTYFQLFRGKKFRHKTFAVSGILMLISISLPLDMIAWLFGLLSSVIIFLTNDKKINSYALGSALGMSFLFTPYLKNIIHIENTAFASMAFILWLSYSLFQYLCTPIVKVLEKKTKHERELLHQLSLTSIPLLVWLIVYTLNQI